MGGIVSGKYDFSLNYWLWTVPRDRVLSFATFTATRNVLIYIPQNPSMDFMLFFRPFTNEVWALMATAMTFIFGGIVVHKQIVSLGQDGGEDSPGQRILSTVAFYFFVLINAYYGAALLNFFTFPASVSFDRLGQFPFISTT